MHHAIHPHERWPLTVPMQPGVRAAARLLGLIVLSCKHVELSVTHCATRVALGKTVHGKPLPLTQPRNPVLLALKLSVMARLSNPDPTFYPNPSPNLNPNPNSNPNPTHNPTYA